MFYIEAAPHSSFLFTFLVKDYLLKKCKNSWFKKLEGIKSSSHWHIAYIFIAVDYILIKNCTPFYNRMGFHCTFKVSNHLHLLHEDFDDTQYLLPLLNLLYNYNLPICWIIDPDLILYLFCKHFLCFATSFPFHYATRNFSRP